MNLHARHKPPTCVERKEVYLTSKKCACRFSRISVMRLIARMVFWYCSRSYLSGRLRFFSNSNVVSYTVPGHSERQQSSNCSVVKRLGALAMRERSSQQASEPAAYQHQLLASGPPEGLGPSHLARVALHLEVVVAFATTESKDLRTSQPRSMHACIIADVQYAISSLVSDRSLQEEIIDHTSNLPWRHCARTKFRGPGRSVHRRTNT